MTKRILEREFEELFKANYSRLFYCALDWVEDAEAAKDIVSDLFEEVWGQYERLREKRMDAYLYRSVRNRSVNYLRHKAVEAQYRQSFFQMRETVIEEDNSVHEENLRLIGKVMDCFTPQTRFIFEQCYFEGKTYQEMAVLMNVSVSAVHKHMNKAFAAFRKAFSEKKDKKGD